MDKTCSEIRDLMTLGPDAADNERIAIESHVSLCAECARELDESRAHLGHLALLREGDMPPGTAERIWERVRPDGAARRTRFVTWAVRVAAMLVIGVSVGYTSRSLAGRAEAPAETAGTSDRDEARSTLIRTNTPSSKAFGSFQQDPPAPVVPFGWVLPKSWTWHYLPQVEELLESDEVRF